MLMMVAFFVVVLFPKLDFGSLGISDFQPEVLVAGAAEVPNQSGFSSCVQYICQTAKI